MNNKLEIICGPMFSGKTEELLRRLRRAQIANKKVQLFKPIIDDRYSLTDVKSHAGYSMQAVPVDDSYMLFDHAQGNDIIGIDEVQFFDQFIIPIVLMLVRHGTTVIASGLDTTFKFQPFGSLPQLLAYAEVVDKFTAICHKCGEEATRTQRLVNGQPAKHDDPIILVGGTESYEARCSKCWEIR